MKRIQPHYIILDAQGRPKLKARFKCSKHRGFQTGAFGKPSK